MVQLVLYLSLCIVFTVDIIVKYKHGVEVHSTHSTIHTLYNNLIIYAVHSIHSTQYTLHTVHNARHTVIIQSKSSLISTKSS